MISKQLLTLGVVMGLCPLAAKPVLSPNYQALTLLDTSVVAQSTQMVSAIPSPSKGSRETLVSFLESSDYRVSPVSSALFMGQEVEDRDVSNLIQLFEAQNGVLDYLEKHHVMVVVTASYPNRLVSEYARLMGEEEPETDYAVGVYDETYRVIYVMKGYQEVPLKTFWHELGHELLTQVSSRSVESAFNQSQSQVKLSAYYHSSADEWFAECFAQVQLGSRLLNDFPVEAADILTQMQQLLVSK